MSLSAPAPSPRADIVLVVDDTPESLHFLSKTLEADGIRVLIATSGEAAIELLNHIRPDLILMDAVMPGMGGFEATRAIKGNPATAGIPVIFMTGLTESEHVLAALDAGGVDYVRKPLVVAELIARVRVHMNNARVSESSQAALDASGRHLIALDPVGQLKWWTPYAGTLLSEHFPGWTLAPGALPEDLRGPIARLLAESGGRSVRVELAQSTLELVRVTQLRGEETLVRLNDVNPAAYVARLQGLHGLTLREAEVLLWLSYGKPNRMISEILTISPRTVNKHLEQIFEKLGVETRAAAAALAVRTLTE
ncbi:response regulator transcription factor [Novosphingobium nitrogenifigens]|uniref:response regulator transcription factor n=1 Tax=Novosphingobium nitrogenifigens TaxID=378548 RepID=UPI0002DAF1D5|nr:response regulator transcription factor [Novosphingobium nitrogenifigens]